MSLSLEPWVPELPLSSLATVSVVLTELVNMGVVSALEVVVPVVVAVLEDDSGRELELELELEVIAVEVVGWLLVEVAPLVDVVAAAPVVVPVDELDVTASDVSLVVAGSSGVVAEAQLDRSNKLASSTGAGVST
jgi:hypothetical protein